MRLNLLSQPKLSPSGTSAPLKAALPFFAFTQKHFSALHCFFKNLQFAVNCGLSTEMPVFLKFSLSLRHVTGPAVGGAVGTYSVIHNKTE